MDDKMRKDIEALIRLLAYAKEETKRLKLSEATQLLEMSELSLYLDYSGIDIEDMENEPDMAVNLGQIFEEPIEKTG